MPGDHAAHRGGDDRRDARTKVGGDAGGKGFGQLRAAPRVHQDARALQVAGAAQAGGQDEMAFEQCLCGAEFGQHLFVGQRALLMAIDLLCT